MSFPAFIGFSDEIIAGIVRHIGDLRERIGAPLQQCFSQTCRRMFAAEFSALIWIFFSDSSQTLLIKMSKNVFPDKSF